MGQKLTMYDFSKIMNEPEDLNVWDVTCSGEIYDSSIERIHFKWEWQGYSGTGEIYLKDGIIDYDNITCRDSKLEIASDSKRKANKHYSVLYNEKNLIVLFEYILSKFNYHKGGENNV